MDITLLENDNQKEKESTIAKEVKETTTIGYIDKYLYIIPIYNDKNDIIMNIPILRNYKPSFKIKSRKDAIYKSFPPMEKKESEQMDYLNQYITSNLQSLVKINAKKNIEITGVSNLTIPEVYFLSIFLNYLGFPFFETDIVRVSVD